MDGIGALILAAGGSSRLGEPKQFLEFCGETLIHAAARAAVEAGCDPVCLVTGETHDRVQSAVIDLSATVIHHPAWQRGIGSSLRFGLQHLADLDLSALLLLVCDQPQLDQQILRALIHRRADTNSPIVASRYARTLGVPALFARVCFSELAQLPDESGAKKVIEADPRRVAHIEFPGGAIDLDSPADVEKWRGRCREEARG